VWLTKQRMSEGPVFGSVDRFEGLGIFFDTYDNERAHVGFYNDNCKSNQKS
jgi:mannose-binding lectin 2